MKELYIAKALYILRAQGPSALMNRIRAYLSLRIYRLLMILHKPRPFTTTQEFWPVDRPLVSVIIPCYNYGRFLPGALESVLAQTFQRLEIIVINDGSTDEFTKQLLANLSYEKTRVVHQRNLGLAQTRNNGAALAEGKYVCFLDPDDFLEPTYLERTLSVLEADDSVGSCYSWVQCFGDRNSLWQTENLNPLVLAERDTAPSHSVIRKLAWEAVARLNGHGFLTKYNGYCEDWVFWIDMLQCGYRGVAVAEPLIRHRVHSASLSATHRPQYEYMLRVMRQDRRHFFYDRTFRRRLDRALNRRICIQNNRINLDCPSTTFASPGRSD